MLTSRVDDDADDDESGGERRVDGEADDDVLVVVVVGGVVVVRRVVVNNENVGRGDGVVDGFVAGLRRVVIMFDNVTSLSSMKLLLRSNQSSKFLVYFPVGSYFSANAVDIKICTIRIFTRILMG